jgi:hypothetical protein
MLTIKIYYYYNILLNYTHYNKQQMLHCVELIKI